VSEVQDTTARVWHKDKSFIIFILKKDDGWRIDGIEPHLDLSDIANLIPGQSGGNRGE